MGVIFGPKNFIADFFGFKMVHFGRKFWKNVQKGVYDFLRKKRNEISKNQGGGGGQRPFGLFPKKHLNLGRR